MTNPTVIARVLEALAAARVPDLALEPPIRLADVREVLDLDDAPLGTELLGRRDVEVARYAAASRRWESGLFACTEPTGDVVLLAGFNPVEPSGEPTVADETTLAALGPPALILDAALGRVMLNGAERVWPERGLAVRINPGNALLLALIVFAPVGAEKYLDDLRPDAEPRQLLRTVFRRVGAPP